MQRRSTTSKDVRWGLGLGLFLAAFFSAMSFVAFLLHGDEPFEGRGLSLGVTVLLNCVGGVIGGILLGLMRPFLNRRLGAALAGTIAMFPVGLMAGYIVDPSRFLTANGIAGAVVVAIILGGGAGLVFWDPPQEAT